MERELPQLLGLARVPQERASEAVFRRVSAARIKDKETVDEIEKTFAGFDADGDGHIGSRELGTVMRTLGSPRGIQRVGDNTGDKYRRVVYGGRGSEGAYTSGTKNPRPYSARW